MLKHISSRQLKLLHLILLRSNRLLRLLSFFLVFFVHILVVSIVGLSLISDEQMAAVDEEKNAETKSAKLPVLLYQEVVVGAEQA